MNKAEVEALEAAGFRIGDAGDFLGLTDEERALVDLRVSVSRAVRRLRLVHHLTQQQVATRIKSTQARVAKVEAGDSGVSLDVMFRGLFAVGGSLDDVSGHEPHGRKRLVKDLDASKRAGNVKADHVIAKPAGNSKADHVVKAKSRSSV